MRNKLVQISLLDIYNDISSAFEDQKSELISLIVEYIDFNSFITYDFYHAFYKNLVEIILIILKVLFVLWLFKNFSVLFLILN